MTVILNGQTYIPEVKCDTVGDILSAAEHKSSTDGKIIIRVVFNGQELDEKSVVDVGKNHISPDNILEIESVSIRDIKIKAHDTIIEFLKTATDSMDKEMDELLLARIKSYRESFAPVFEPEEISWLDELEKFFISDHAKELHTHRKEILGNKQRMFLERLHELTEPENSMKEVISFFSDQEPLLAEVPLKLQTGKDGEAINNVLKFIELFNKTNRILQSLSWSGFNTALIKPSGEGLKQFYDSINQILKEMIGAFERKDTVLLGDLVEYEIIPRMSIFYEAVTNAMESR